MILRRILILLSAFVLCLGLGVTSAYAFANGTDFDMDGVGDDGYGTHDWILDHAIELAGADASWVDTTTAVLASDDPDDPDNPSKGTSKYLHVFKEFGRGRGAPQAVSDEYYQLMLAYRAGNYAEASRRLGLLSHYYADVCQPFHTKYDSSTLAANLHVEYEHDVQRYTDKRSESPEWRAARSRQPVTDVRKKAVAAGKYSRGKYDDLLVNYAGSQEVTSGVPYAVTADVLSRAVNDLADIICAVNDGAGLAERPADVTPYVSKRYPAQNTSILGSAKIVDSQGKPMEGVRVDLVWEMKGKPPCAVTLYTLSDGIARWSQNIGPSTMMRRRTLYTTSFSSGEVVNDATWYVPSPKLKAGTKGVKTTLSNRKPKKNTVVRAKTKFVNTSGKPVKGLKVTFTWAFKSGTKKTYAYTNKYGNAHASMNIKNAKKGYTVKVKGSAMSGGTTRSSTTTFRTR